MPIYFNSKSKEYGWLSNMYPAPFRNKDKLYFHSSEHYYMWSKAADEKDRINLLNVKDSWEAKRLGRKVRLRPDWSTYKLVAMKWALWGKFTQNPDLKAKLLATGDEELIEYAPWGDTYWGVNRDKVGQNNLGKLLMELRTKLRS